MMLKKLTGAAMAIGVLCTMLAGVASAQTVSIPTLFRMTGALTQPDGTPRAGNVVMVASLYRDAQDTTPLWTEQQAVELAAGGRYVLSVGATLPDGVPKEFFLAGEGRWLAVGLAGEAEQPRIMLVNVPYATKAFEAEQLGGKTASDFVLNSTLTSSIRSVMGDPIPAPGIVPGPNSVYTTNYLPKSTDNAGAFSPSLINEVAGFIGINNAAPADALDVKGIFRVTGAVGAPNYARFDNTANAGKTWRFGNTGAAGATSFDIYNQTNGVLGLTIASTGSVGIGIAAPTDPLEVKGILRIGGILGAPNYLRFDNTVNSGGKVWRFGNTGAGSAATFDIYNQTDGVVGLSVTSTGSVGVGTTTPTSKLDVVGSINVSGNINAKYQDVAEWVETPTPLEDGTVVIVDPDSPNRVIAASTAYDTRLAGAVSRQPGLILGEKGDNKAMIAANGRVIVKVDATYGEVKIGDLLVASPTPGYAMKSVPITVGGQTFHRAGTILGKALQALPNGKGEILVLLIMQ